MSQSTSVLLATEIKAIIDTELSKPLPRLPEVKHALRRLGFLLVDLSTAADALEQDVATLRARLDSFERRNIPGLGVF